MRFVGGFFVLAYVVALAFFWAVLFFLVYISFMTLTNLSRETNLCYTLFFISEEIVCDATALFENCEH